MQVANVHFETDGKRPQRRPARQLTASPKLTLSTERDGNDALVCAHCGYGITHDGARIEVNGEHEHVFVNPHGYDFHIGCFARAPGVVSAGPSSNEFTWFSGFSWQLDLCRGCTGHLGWIFRSPRKQFHGLVLDRLVSRNVDSSE